MRLGENSIFLAKTQSFFRVFNKKTDNSGKITLLIKVIHL